MKSKSDIVCRDCRHAVIEPSKGGYEMAHMRYRSCSVAPTPENGATYFSGAHVCAWPQLAKAK